MADNETVRVHVHITDEVTAVCEAPRSKYYNTGANTALKFRVVELIAPRRLSEEEPW